MFTTHRAPVSSKSSIDRRSKRSFGPGYKFEKNRRKKFWVFPFPNRSLSTEPNGGFLFPLFLPFFLSFFLSRVGCSRHRRKKTGICSILVCFILGLSTFSRKISSVWIYSDEGLCVCVCLFSYEQERERERKRKRRRRQTHAALPEKQLATIWNCFLSLSLSRHPRGGH